MTAIIAVLAWPNASWASSPVRAVLEGAERLRRAGPVAGGTIVADLLDDEELARRLLGVHHAGLNQGQRAAMKEAVRAFAAAAWRRHQPELGAFALSCRAVKAGPEYAAVHCDVRRNGKSVPLALLLRRSGRWRVFDIETTGLALLRDNAPIADTVIRREGFEGYLRRLAERREGMGTEQPMPQTGGRHEPSPKVPTPNQVGD